MQIAHVISDAILAATCLYVFFKYLLKLNLSNTILWESFVLSVAAAAIFGAISFAGIFPEAQNASSFFRKIASITGGVGLVGAAYALVNKISLSKTACYIILVLGFLLFAVAEGFNQPLIAKWTPIACMGLITILAIMAFIKGDSKAGLWLLTSVIFFALGTFRTLIFGEGDFTIDVFHFLTAAGVLSLGMAAGQSK